MVTGESRVKLGCTSKQRSSRTGIRVRREARTIQLGAHAFTMQTAQ